jgi:predicted metalloenzyme YecM
MDVPPGVAEEWNNLEAFRRFQEKAESLLSQYDIDVTDKEIDHLCMRFDKKEIVDELVNHLVLEKGAYIISKKKIAGRDIFILKLAEPIKFLGHDVYFLELPYPKVGHAFANGWEHFEVVLESDASTPDEMLEIFHSNFPHVNLSELLDQKVITIGAPIVDEGKQAPNPDVTIRGDGLVIKFHPASIEKIVEAEN